MGTSTQTPSLPLFLCPHFQLPRDLERGQGSLWLAELNPAACQVPSCPGRGSLAAESPPHPPPCSSRGHARPLAAGIAATALEKHQHTSALQGDCAHSPGRESRGGRVGAAAGGGHRPLGHPPEPAQDPTLSILPQPRLHNDLVQDGTRLRGAQAGPKAGKVAAGSLPHWLHHSP